MSLLMRTNNFASMNISGVSGFEPSLFQEAALDSVYVDRSFDLNMMRLDAFTEATERELALNIAKSELKCMVEGGTVDDLVYLEEAASEGAIAKFKQMIQKVIDTFKQWCSQKKTKVIAKIASKDARTVLGKAEKKLKFNPLLARKKVQVTSIKKPLGVIHSYKSKNDKILGKVVKGILKETTMKTIADTKESFREDFRASIAGTAGTVTMTVAAVLSAVQSDVDKLPSFMEKMESQTTAALERLKTTCTEEAANSATAATNAAANFGAELAKEEVNVLIDGIMNKMAVLRQNVLRAKGEKEVPKVKAKAVKESAEDVEENEVDIEAYEESAAEYYADLYGDAFVESGNTDTEELGEYEESADEKVDDSYFEDLFGESAEESEEEDGELLGEYEESADDSYFEDLYGTSEEFEESSNEEVDDSHFEDLFGESAEESEETTEEYEESVDDSYFEDLYGTSEEFEESAEEHELSDEEVDQLIAGLI